MLHIEYGGAGCRIRSVAETHTSGSSSSGKNLSSVSGLHSLAEAVLLGALSFLRMISIAHQHYRHTSSLISGFTVQIYNCIVMQCLLYLIKYHYVNIKFQKIEILAELPFLNDFFCPISANSIFFSNISLSFANRYAILSE